MLHVKHAVNWLCKNQGRLMMLIQVFFIKENVRYLVGT